VVVINNLDIVCILAIPSKADTVFLVHADRELAFAIPLEPFKLVAWRYTEDYQFVPQSRSLRAVSSRFGEVRSADIFVQRA